MNMFADTLNLEFNAFNIPATVQQAPENRTPIPKNSSTSSNAVSRVSPSEYAHWADAPEAGVQD